MSTSVRRADWTAGLIRSLASGRWSAEHNNVLIAGPDRHRQELDLPVRLGNQAARDGFSVLYQRLSRLLDELAIARADGKCNPAAGTARKVRLLIIDDWAMVKLTADQRRDLMEVIDDRHQRGSTILATQIPLDRWHDQIGDPTYADAILDRLVHNAYRIELRGGSMRQRRAPLSTDGKTKANKDVDDVIPDTHAIHGGAAAAT